MSRSYHQKHPVKRCTSRSSKKWRFPDPLRSHIKMKPYGRVENSGPYAGEIYLRSLGIETTSTVCKSGAERQQVKRNIEKELQESEYNIC